MVFRNVNPNKFKTEQDFEDKSMSIKEFTQIFKKDPVSEKLTQKLIQLAYEKQGYYNFEMAKQDVESPKIS